MKVWKAITSPWLEVVAMRKLLTANFFRLWKNKIFWAEIGSTALLSVFIVIANYSPEVQAMENRLYLDDVFFTMYQILGFILATGISLIVGTEYSDGTIRNKLTVGSTRTQVYFSNLIASAIPSCFVLIVHGIITYGIGYFLFGSFQMQVGQVVTALLCALLTAFVFSALFVAIAMNCPNKAITAVVSLLLVLGLVYLSSAIGNALTEPEMTYDGITITMDGVQFGEEIQNPAHVDGFNRTLYEFVYDLLPTGQLIQMYCQDFSRCARWPMFSMVIFVLLTAIGFLAFRKRDIR